MICGKASIKQLGRQTGATLAREKREAAVDTSHDLGEGYVD